MKQANEDQFDDTHDSTAAALREQAPRARLDPSLALHQRTIDALHAARPEVFVIPHPARRRWLSLLAAAAMLTFAILLTRVFLPGSGGTIPSAGDGGGIVRAPSTLPPQLRLPRVLPQTPHVRLATLTQPLEREAEALRTDIRRISSHLRSAIAREDK